MHRNIVPQSNRAQDGGPGAPAPATTPKTPRKDGATLSSIIRSLEDEFRLGLDIREGPLSPSQRSDALTGKVYAQIKHLYWSFEPALEKALDSFRQIATGFIPEKRLEVLHGILKSQTPSPMSRAGTPLSSQTGLSNVPPKSLIPSTSNFSRVSQSPSLLQLHRDTAPTFLQPGSPTDVDDDEDEFVTPPSPTLFSQSAQRRVQQASSHTRFASGPIARKRASDSSEEPATSPKLTRTSKGKQPSISPPGPLKTSSSTILFKKPSLDMARSFQATAPTKASADTSFDTVSSSQQTQPDTAETSFTSDAYDADIGYPKLTRTSSTKMSLLDEQDLVNVSVQLERETAEFEMRRSQVLQELTGESSSTFGSIDDGFLETSFHAEAELETPMIPPLRSPSFQERTPHASDLMSSPSPLIAPPATPAQTGLLSAQTPHSAISPSKLPYYIREIPEKDLFVEQLSEPLQKFPYFILFICCRIANDTGVSIHELMRDMDVADIQSSPGTFWKTVRSHPKVERITCPEPATVWSAAKRHFDGYTFKGRVIFKNLRTEPVPVESPVFGLQLLPIEADKSCRLQRKFGSHRFIYLNLPAFDSGVKTRPARFSGGEMSQIQEQWQTWFHKEHYFLGRKWRAFHIEPIKRKSGRRPRDDNSARRMVMFATEGVGIEPVSLGKMLNWFFPFAGNMDQNFCKAYARIDLGLSRTIPTLAFKPSQIRRVDDIRANGTPEDSRFIDSTLVWDETPEPEAVMNDGCSRMSVGAALQIWQRYREATDTKNEPMPSVFQGRIGGAKGLWMVCGEPSSNYPEELDIWIEITPSQRKFEPHLEDLFDDQFDKLRLTFEHVNHSSRPTSSELHISFIPIMVDRGVSREVLANLINNSLDAERDELLKILPIPVKLYHWLHKHSQNITDEDTRWQAALPHSLPNKISLLLESGFYPEHEPYLARVLHRYIKYQQVWMEQKLKVSLGKATFVYGVADPLGVLAPGEVHLDFSSPFVDEYTGNTYRTLKNMDLLVARQPACRRSDIQKVRAVQHPELSHLVDVVVFPSTGQYPLAGKLQGGDYDGDTFWICWEPDLVRPFKNAPAPLATLDHEQYGIEKDTRKLHEVMNHRDLSTVDNLLEQILDFRMAPSLLGRVTVFLEKQAYRENQLYSQTLNALCDMHDLLVDAPKNGYRFTEDDYSKFIQRDLRCGNPKMPAYMQAMQDCADAKELGEVDKTREKDYKHRKDNILDYLYFEVVRKHDLATIKSVEEAFSKEASDDPAIQYPYINLRDNGSRIVNAEISALVERIKELHKQWSQKLNNIKHNNRLTLTSDAYNKTVDVCYRDFRALLPTDVDHPDIKPLLNRYLHYDFSIWESVRASALYTALPKRNAFVWHMAGRELAKLKSGSLSGVKSVIPSIFANLKPKPAKAPKPEEAKEEGEDELESAVESLST